ncbi:3'(2'),5'-bisphosphate nucleotidase CysQ [Rhodococcoides kyotonense]|uniref:3'(2'), 5'-bisphosphate nucleotidase n=1 Tax=Rhodococcoides kyotonense TaxID=398843 RepID=A0A239HTL9_9NOCA|nr:3'(2'),5'-bisphosphate nucleotidase CysQ [Rhodococcus kyotonensis]SNS84565.1 3'(2'), 5'-bisphosphate nucleotidase [Rhodococcus kyotonensis]
MTHSTQQDSEFAADVARAAGELLLRIRDTSDVRGRELGRLGDTQANDLILNRVRAERPGDSVLSEESADDLTRLDASRVWIIDPLDGSREYGMAGRGDWAVHVGLWEAGKGMTASAVAQPALGVVYSTADVTLSPAVDRRPQLVVSDSRPPYYMDALAADVGGDVVTMGSAGAKAMAVVRGDVDAYVHSGGQWEWDSAAPVGVALAAGLHCSRIDGEPLTYNNSHPYVPDLLICRPELAEPLLRGIATHATREADSGRVAMAREYIKALVSHDATKLRLADACRRVENGRSTGDTGQFICDDLEQGQQYKPIVAVRELNLREWGSNVVGRYLLDLDGGITVSVTEHFEIPAGDITAITAIIEPA